ncbi:class I SAM-dependent methyltransferase [Amycolatopsis anabasis]|uniref:class I SAM-dependent methyltransferase n=1 Tax=Amycolatopsis anabasis TaxID=1840409 RepID=UPI00131DDA11|nr:class I SAM-dependent methyltransferase [Amycolatopsis anabasis]
MYDQDFAEIYDDVYRRHRNYPREAAHTKELALAHCPAAASLLDVGCGTGEHLKYLREDFEVAGVDLAEPMVEIARRKLGDVPVHQGDMRTFDLGRTFDVVCSVYSPVGYLRSADDLCTAVLRMAAHLSPGGVLIVEPWILRENWNGGDLATATFEVNGRRVVRMGKWKTRDDQSYVEMHYLVGDSETVRHFVDRQDLTLFSREQYEKAFIGAGCSVEFLEQGYGDRGVFVGTRLDGRAGETNGSTRR